MSATLVTGGAGFAGSHLIDLLVDAGADVTAWHRPGGSPPRERPGVRWDAVDLLDREGVDAAIARVRPSAVYHCAGEAHVARANASTESTFAINVRGTHYLLEALERLDAPVRVLVPGSALVYESANEALTEAHPLKPASPYALSKLAQEMLAGTQHGPLAVTIARAFNHLGPRQDPHFAASGFARRIADIERGRWAPEISVGNLDARRDMTDVRDTVRAYRLILERGQPGRPYNICSGHAMAIRELLDRLLARARVPVEVKVDPARYRPNDTPLLLGDATRLREELGWTPEIPIERTLDDLLDLAQQDTMKILVTGGTGYLGRAVVGALAARGHELVIFARGASRSGLPGTAIDGDVRDRAALERAATGCDAISHSAALVSIWRRRREDFDDINVGGLRHIVEVAAALGTPRVLYTSSFVALPPRGRTEPLVANDYQRTKVAADRLADDAVRNGCPLIRVYPGVVYGPGSFTEGNLVGRLIADHLKHKLPGLIGPEQRWSYAYVDDVAAGHASALERGRIGGRYALGGENAPQGRVFEIVREITGRRPPPRIPFPIADLLGAAEELRVTLFGGTPLVTRGAVDIFRHDWSLDSSEAIRDLGYAITPLADGVRRTVESIRG